MHQQIKSVRRARNFFNASIFAIAGQWVTRWRTGSGQRREFRRKICLCKSQDLESSSNERTKGSDRRIFFPSWIAWTRTRSLVNPLVGSWNARPRDELVNHHTAYLTLPRTYASLVIKQGAVAAWLRETIASERIPSRIQTERINSTDVDSVIDSASSVFGNRDRVQWVQALCLPCSSELKGADFHRKFIVLPRLRIHSLILVSVGIHPKLSLENFVSLIFVRLLTKFGKTYYRNTLLLYLFLIIILHLQLFFIYF